jgi:hypothetical protein
MRRRTAFSTVAQQLANRLFGKEKLARLWDKQRDRRRRTR